MTTPQIEVPGPWQHRYIAAHGARFHVSTMGTGPPVLLLHGFPQFWWAWRHQLVALAEAGHQAIAMDLRGYGGSDKTPRGYDPFTLAGDVAGVIKALGLPSAVVVGAGWGGYVGWATAALHPDQVSALCAVSAPHPTAMLRSLRPGLAATAHLAAAQVPWLPERRLTASVGAHLRAWSGSAFPSSEEVERYQQALELWPAPHCALEYHRWLVRSRFRSDGRRFAAALRRPVGVSSYTIFGGADPALPDPRRDRSSSYVSGVHRSDIIEGVGHFAPEENPVEFNRLLLEWLAS